MFLLVNIQKNNTLGKLKITKSQKTDTIKNNDHFMPDYIH